MVANLSLHWTNDLPGALIQLRTALRPDGLLLASLPILPSLAPLRAALLEAEAALTGGASPRVSPFPELRDCAALLQRAGYALPEAHGRGWSSAGSGELTAFPTGGTSDAAATARRCGCFGRVEWLRRRSKGSSLPQGVMRSMRSNMVGQASLDGEKVFDVVRRGNCTSAITTSKGSTVVD